MESIIQSESNKAVYLTQANAAKVVCNIVSPKSLSNLSGELFRRPIYLFNEYERQRLLAIRKFFEDSEGFLDGYYRKAPEAGQNANYVFPDSTPVYHLMASCPCLHADYENIEIPAQISVRGSLARQEFRSWALAHKHEYDAHRERFLLRLCGRFNINRSELILVDRENTRTTKMANHDLGQIDRQINCLLGEAGAFYKESDKNSAILRKYQKHTSLAYTDQPLRANDTGYDDAEVKVFLLNYDVCFKRPLKRLLTTYFRVQFNKDMQFSGALMEQLNLKPCSSCQRSLRHGSLNPYLNCVAA